jgi:hypothetical protein
MTTLYDYRRLEKQIPFRAYRKMTDKNARWHDYVDVAARSDAVA